MSEDAFYDDEADECECGYCGGQLAYLGKLGTVTHFRCINCALVWSEGGPDVD